MADLSPPRKSVELQDPGAHELESSDENDHFSDASEGKARDGADRSTLASPIPITRVERVDDNPAHGEVPGTAAYKMRTQDAVPDEVEIVPDGTRSRSSSRIRPEDRPSSPGSPIPKTVVEKIDPDAPSHGDVPGTDAHEKRRADAEPDEVKKAPAKASSPLGGSPTTSSNRCSPGMDRLTNPPSATHDSAFDDGGVWSKSDDSADEQEATNDDMDLIDGNGDDFDDFEEGAEDDDFGEFDDGFQEPAPPPPTAPHPSAPPPPHLSLPILDYTDLTDTDALATATQPYTDQLFPGSLHLRSPNRDFQKPTSSIFQSERSLSLWSQLVAPPPLQPPNWVRSRIRRLFLVSLGVPVDLDEILPASKQKKLVLPSIDLPSRSPRASTDSRANGAVSRLKATGANESSGSLNSAAGGAAGARAEGGGTKKRRGPPAPPELNLNSARLLCSTTEAALRGCTDGELRAHVGRLEELIERAGGVLVYWERRRESARGDKEAFEGVIENLVSHARKVRK